MLNIDNYQILFLVNAFLFQLILMIHFGLRRWRFELAMRYGWIVYALSIPYAIASLFILRGGETWALWLGGFIYLVWAIYGYIVEYVKKIEWRNSVSLPILVAYIILYLATVMFYWWPLALIYKPFWYVYGVLFIISTCILQFFESLWYLTNQALPVIKRRIVMLNHYQTSVSTRW